MVHRSKALKTLKKKIEFYDIEKQILQKGAKMNQQFWRRH
jgi:hypothetical protein